MAEQRGDLVEYNNGDAYAVVVAQYSDDSGTVAADGSADGTVTHADLLVFTPSFNQVKYNVPKGTGEQEFAYQA